MNDRTSTKLEVPQIHEQLLFYCDGFMFESLHIKKNYEHCIRNRAKDYAVNKGNTRLVLLFYNFHVRHLLRNANSIEFKYVFWKTRFVFVS